MKIKRIVSLIVCLVLTVTLLSACSLGSNANANISYVNEEGRFIYPVIRGAESSAAVEKAAKDIRNAIKNNFGCKTTLVKDFIVENVEGSYEVLVGNTNRPESAEALEIVSSARSNNNYDFIVKVINNKVCIQAVTDDMISIASQWFVKTFCVSLETWGLLENGYEFLYQPDVKTIDNIVEGVNLGLFTVVKPLKMSYLAGIEVERFIKFYKNNGFEIKYVEDIDEATEYEILIGNTSREESKSVKVEGDNYVIKVIGKKVVIKGGSDLALYSAVKHFTDLVEASKNGEGFNWTDGYVINGKYDKEEKDTYTLNFYDDFNGSQLDFTVWGDHNYESLRSRASSLGGRLWYASPKNESAAYGKPLPHKNVYVADGNLVLSTYRLNETDFVGTNVSTYYSMLFKYGVWEIYGKQSVRPGCMSYWAQGAGEGNLESRYGSIRRIGITEIDLIETFGSETNFASNIHRWWTDTASDGITPSSGHNSMDGVSKYKVDGNNKSYFYDTERYGDKLSDDYHYYSCYWNDDGLYFAFDGKKYCSYEFSGENSVSIHCLLNYIIFHFRMGDVSYGTTFKRDSDPEYVESYVDWVKIYQTDAINSQMVKSYGEFSPYEKETVVMYPDNPIKGSY